MLRKRRLPTAAALTVVVAVVLGAPALAGAATATTTTASGTATSRPSTAKQLVAAVEAAAKAQTSVHFLAKSSLEGRTVTITASTSATNGTQVIVLHNGKSVGHMSGRLVNKIVYFKGDTYGLEEYLGMPATLAPKYSEKWIFFSPATKDYSAIEKSMTLDAAVSQISLSGPYATGTSTVAGQAAETVTGTTASLSSKGNKGKATLYVAASGTPLPIRYVGKGKQKKQKETGTVTFSNWGKKVNPVTPQGAVAASSIASTG
jgi:hypothetical protein